MQQPVGEDVPSLAVRCQLRLVQRDECSPTPVARHGLGGAQEIPGIGRLDPLLAGDQRYLLLALDGDDPVVDLARQQAQRETHRPARMAAHPLDREMGLAGIGGSENRLDACVAHGPDVALQGACRNRAERPAVRRNRPAAASPILNRH